MPRQPRKPSGTGIHHIMMRGINHQNIFEDAEDYYQFITTLDRMRHRYDDDGLPCGTNCTYYAYCLMSNHFHLLIREREETVGETLKRIASSYVYYYNRKKTKTGTTNSSAFQQLDESIKQQVFLDLKDCGASLRQLERLTGIGKGVIHRIWTAR